MASFENNGHTFTRVCATYGVAKTDVNLSFSLKFLTIASTAIGKALLVTENCICKFSQDTVEMVDKKMVNGRSATESNSSDTISSEQCFYFPDKNGS
jgi:hypothetical protein